MEDLNWAWSNTKTEIDLRIVNLLTDELNKTTINTEEIQKSNNFVSTTIDEESKNSKNDEISLTESKNDLPVSKHDSSSKHINVTAQHHSKVPSSQRPIIKMRTSIHAALYKTLYLFITILRETHAKGNKNIMYVCK